MALNFENIKVNLGNDKVLSVRVDTYNDSKDFGDVSICIEDEQGNFLQDIVSVQHPAEYDNKDYQVIVDKTKFQVLVWGDENDEDYTSETIVKIGDYEI